MVKVAVVLSGCGYLDGSEIHESVLTLLALDRAGAVVTCLAPDVAQSSVIDHVNKEPANEKRNVLVESARIARGKIADVARAKAADFDAVVLPGGYGAAKNLCNFAVKGAAAEVEPAVARFLREAFHAKKPIGAWCIAPATVAAALRDEKAGLKLTIGSDPATASALQAMGAKHVTCPVDEARTDDVHRIVSTPAYMCDARIAEVAAGIDIAVAALLKMAR
ncbi:MAG: isoprenoid biosynthesis glyoxalase ElbB [Planctomycetes bacterium]|nr:isoprenoid biosynthesis glyoxalase ElbB [Planctomycetota bacterium]